MSFESSLIMLLTVRQQEQSLENMYPKIFWSRCLIHILNLLMHDIIKIKVLILKLGKNSDDLGPARLDDLGKTWESLEKELVKTWSSLGQV